MWAKRCKAASLAPSLSIPITVIGQCTGQVLLRPRTTLEAGLGGRPDRRGSRGAGGIGQRTSFVIS